MRPSRIAFDAAFYAELVIGSYVACTGYGTSQPLWLFHPITSPAFRRVYLSPVVSSFNRLDAQEMSTFQRISSSEITRIVDAIREDYGSGLSEEEFLDVFLECLENIPGLELVDGRNHMACATASYFDGDQDGNCTTARFKEDL